MPATNPATPPESNEAKVRRLEARVAELEAAIQKHKDKYIFSSPDFEDLELWKTLVPKP